MNVPPSAESEYSMEFHEKLQQLRKQKGLTQEELAEFLYVSRTAVSKWESGRGYPNIDSLKAIAQFFSVTIDGLLYAAEELPSVKDDSSGENPPCLRVSIFGLLDLSSAALLFLPLFAQKTSGVPEAVSLLAFTGSSLWLRSAYFAIVFGLIVSGILLLALPNIRQDSRAVFGIRLSFLWNAAGVLLFILSPQPYAAALLFVFLGIKGYFLAKKQ